jgi:hypothetical protein
LSTVTTFIGESSAIPVVVAENDSSSHKKLRTGGEKGRDLQTTAIKPSLAQAIANGLRVPISSKQKQKPTLPSVQQQNVKILPANATPKTRSGTPGKPSLPSIQQQSVKIVAANATPKTRAGTSGNKTRGRSSQNKKRSNTTKERTVNKKQTNANKKRSNNRVNVNSKKRKSSSKNNRGNSRNYKQSSNNKRTRVSGGSTNKHSAKNMGYKKTRASGGSTNKQPGKNSGNQSGNMMNQRYSSSTSSFLHGINQALSGNKGSSGGGWGGSGKPVMKYPMPVSGWGGSAPQEPPIIWDGGEQTEYGVTGVLMPCACYGEQSAWGSSSSSSAWGSSTTAGKSGKSSSEKEHSCLCLVSELLPDDLPTTFMPTYFP